jgi:hypothetical protein
MVSSVKCFSGFKTAVISLTILLSVARRMNEQEVDSLS